MNLETETVTGIHNSNTLSYFGRASSALGAFGLAGVMLLNPEIATADDSLTVSYSRPALSSKEAFQACQENVRVVAHEGSDPRSKTKFTVNTMRWMKHEIKKGHNIIEVDTQVSSDNSFFGFHDRFLNANTRNGSGVAHSKKSAYLSRLRTLSGDRLSGSSDLIRVLHQNPNVKLQHEFKDYDAQWTPKRLQLWHQEFSDAGVLSQINVSSASARVIKWFSKYQPDVTDKQLIGFGNHLPSLQTAKRVEATQVNVTSVAGLRNSAKYLRRAQDIGLRTSVRSNPNGNGDDGRTWLRAIENNVDQIVTQGPTKSFVCRAVFKAAKKN